MATTSDGDRRSLGNFFTKYDVFTVNSDLEYELHNSDCQWM